MSGGRTCSTGLTSIAIVSIEKKGALPILSEEEPEEIALSPDQLALLERVKPVDRQVKFNWQERNFLNADTCALFGQVAQAA